MSGVQRPILLLFMLCAPLGWLMFWAVFHTAPGQDWVVFHTAAALFRAGDFKTLDDPRAFTDAMNATHAAWFAKPISVLHPWVYPPVTLLLALAFGWMVYPVSLAVFLAITIAAMAAALWPWEATLRGRLMLIGCVLLCPATAFAIGAGQLSFLIAAAVLTALWLLDTRPFLSGLIFSLLCLKPQFVPLIPVALLAGRHVRAIAGGLAGGLGLVGLSAVVIGVRAWVDWIDLASGTDPVLGKLIDVVRVYDQSVHTCLRMLGATDGVAGMGQLLAIGLAAICIWIAFSRPYVLRQRAIVLLCALVAGAPHVEDYDHVLLAIAVMLVLLDGARGMRAGLAAAAWLATMFNPPALIAVLGVPALTALSALTGFLPAALMLVETMGKARKQFFSEEKHQKTFMS
jgi:alpha-1,2-mannosyltransferase